MLGKRSIDPCTESRRPAPSTPSRESLPRQTHSSNVEPRQSHNVFIMSESPQVPSFPSFPHSEQPVPTERHEVSHFHREEETAWPTKKVKTDPITLGSTIKYKSLGTGDSDEKYNIGFSDSAVNLIKSGLSPSRERSRSREKKSEQPGLEIKTDKIQFDLSSPGKSQSSSPNRGEFQGFGPTGKFRSNAQRSKFAGLNLFESKNFSHELKKK